MELRVREEHIMLLTWAAGCLDVMWMVFAIASLVSGVLFMLLLPLAICSPIIANMLVVLDVLLRQWWQRRHPTLGRD